jgi:hypothetical protein
MDPDIEIAVIDLADKWSDFHCQSQGDTTESYLDKKSKMFDRAYKAIIKTMGYTEEPVG